MYLLIYTYLYLFICLLIYNSYNIIYIWPLLKGQATFELRSFVFAEGENQALLDVFQCLFDS